jgi:hypothetical protein
LACGQPKIALQIADEAELNALYEEAKAAGLNACVVHDAGHTQVAAGTATVLAIGPGLLVSLCVLKLSVVSNLSISILCSAGASYRSNYFPFEAFVKWHSLLYIHSFIISSSDQRSNFARRCRKSCLQTASCTSSQAR